VYVVYFGARGFVRESKIVTDGFIVAQGSVKTGWEAQIDWEMS
jgi:hypothetical protein